MGLREKLRDFGSKIVRAFQKKPKIDHDTLQRLKDRGAFSVRVGGDAGKAPEYRKKPLQPLPDDLKAKVLQGKHLLKGGGN